MYNRMGREADALKYFMKAAELDLKDENMCNQVVYYLQEANKKEEALRLCESYLKIDSRAGCIYYKMAILLAKEKCFKQAIECIKKGSEVDPVYCSVYYF